MKIDIEKVKKPTLEEIYRVGNVIQTGKPPYFYLVVSTEHGYALVDLNTNMTINESETLLELAKDSTDEDDQLIDVKIVRA